jgi:asparagine synthetase B (glutamine-hydrolysing)
VALGHRRLSIINLSDAGAQPMVDAGLGPAVTFNGCVYNYKELPALLAGGGVGTRLDPIGLHHYLTWHSIVPAPRTILRGVSKLPPATVRVLEPGRAARDRVYWQPSYSRRPEHVDWTVQDWRDAAREALRTAVRRRMVADVEVGVLVVRWTGLQPRGGFAGRGGPATRHPNNLGAAGKPVPGTPQSALAEISADEGNT